MNAESVLIARDRKFAQAVPTRKAEICARNVRLIKGPIARDAMLVILEWVYGVTSAVCVRIAHLMTRAVQTITDKLFAWSVRPKKVHTVLIARRAISKLEVGVKNVANVKTVLPVACTVVKKQEQ